jgi:hypothetical protein
MAMPEWESRKCWDASVYSENSLCGANRVEYIN